MDNAAEKKIALTHFWVAFIAFAAACLMGGYQVIERSGFISALQSREVYYASTSTHGVLMAFVLTTFFIMGFGYYVATTTLNLPVWNKTFAWTGFGVALLGVLLAALPLLTGAASVLFTFYPPMQAHVLFYIGAALLVVGSWFWCVSMVVLYLEWK
jgi:cytochrome c oxidase subunit 1